MAGGAAGEAFVADVEDMEGQLQIRGIEDTGRKLKWVKFGSSLYL